MKYFVPTALVESMLATAALLLAGPAAGESAGSTAVSTTISRLASNGYRVIVNRVGDAPLAQCTVNQVRPGTTTTRRAPGLRDELVTTVTKSVYLDVVC